MNKVVKYVGIPVAGGVALVLGSYLAKEIWNYVSPVQPIIHNIPTPIFLEADNSELKGKISGLEKQVGEAQKEKLEVEGRIKDVEKQKQDVEGRVRILLEEKGKMFDAELETPDPTNTQNFKGTYDGSRPSFIKVGIGATELHDGAYLEGRLLTSISDIFANAPVLAELNLKAQEGNYFRGKEGEYRMPIGGSLEGSLLLDVGQYLKEFDVLALGLFAKGDYARFQGALDGEQSQVTLGPRVLAVGKDNQWQADARLGFRHRRSRFNGMEETANGVALDANGAAYLGKGFILALNGSIGFLDGQTKGFGYNVDTDNLELQGGVGLAWNVNRFLQLYTDMSGLWGSKKYDDEGRMIPFRDDQYSMGDVGIGAHIMPFGTLYQYDQNSRLFKPAEDLYFDLRLGAMQTPGKVFDPTINLEIGKKF